MEYHSKTLEYIGKPVGAGSAAEIDAAEEKLGPSVDEIEALLPLPDDRAASAQV